MCKFLNPQHCNTLCIRDYLFLKNVKKCCKIFLFLDTAQATDRAGMLNLYSVYSASNVRRLCAFWCPAISFLQFHVLQFHALQIGPSISRPSFSRPAFSAPPGDLIICPMLCCNNGTDKSNRVPYSVAKCSFIKYKKFHLPIPAKQRLLFLMYIRREM